MITRLLKKTNLSILTNRLNQDSMRQKVLANNIANVNTVDYKAKEVAFNDILHRTAKQLNTVVTNPVHLSSNSNPVGKVVDIENVEIQNGINNVDIDEQMVELARNHMDFNFSATHLGRLFKSMKICIRGKV